MFNKSGIPTLEMVKSHFPEKAVLAKAKAVIECYEEIPCNPCSTSCPTGAIYIGEDINRVPEIDYGKCIGCALCVTACPGLAIITCQLAEGKAHFKIPYEMLPYPKVGATWLAVNRAGDVIGEAYINKVLSNKNQDKTLILDVIVDKALLYDFITVRCPNE